jgi:acyl carrier protein
MKENELIKTIKLVINDYFKLQGIEEKVSVDTILFGSSSLIDSLGFVNIIVDIENQLKEQNIDISLMSEKAMSQRNSPFKSVSSLVSFIKEEIEL